MAKPKHERRNLNPTAEAYAAMYIWSKEYGDQADGSMDFWDSLSERRKDYCRELVAKIKVAEGLAH